MTIIGTGEAFGAISILHALGAGKGCSIPVKLLIRVNIHDVEMTNDEDKHGILSIISSIWEEKGYPVPPVIGWEVISEIPIGQGLKSSSALSCAAIRALDKASWTCLSDYEIVDLAVEAQRRSGCTISGSMDDTWATLTSGWKAVDPSKTPEESILFEGDIEPGFSVLIGLRGSRKSDIIIESFHKNSQIFDRALASLINGSILDSLSSNGMAVASSTDDFEALRISNLMIASGAVAAGISGSGPAIAVVCYASDSEYIGAQLSELCDEVISTQFLLSKELVEGA